MIGFAVSQAKSFILSSERTLQAVDKATASALKKFGAFVRREDQSSIRSRKKVSSPGSPPSNRTRKLKKFIFFVYDQGSKSVLVGPAKFNQVFFNGAGQPVSGTIPQILEEGGTIKVLEWQLQNGKWYRADLRSKRRIAERQAEGRVRLRTAKVAARPHTLPAYQKEKPKLAGLLRNSVKG